MMSSKVEKKTQLFILQLTSWQLAIFFRKSELPLLGTEGLRKYALCVMQDPISGGLTLWMDSYML